MVSHLHQPRSRKQRRPAGGKGALELVCGPRVCTERPLGSRRLRDQVVSPAFAMQTGESPGAEGGALTQRDPRPCQNRKGPQGWVNREGRWPGASQ